MQLEAYMNEASEGGTYVHKHLELTMQHLKRTDKQPQWEAWVKSWRKFLRDYKVKPISIERYVSDKFFQWTIDLVAEITIPTKGEADNLDVSQSETYIIDWKTYWLAKGKFGLESERKYVKPYDKLKKASLQLSLYAYVLWIDNIAVVELSRNGYHFHKLKRMSNREIRNVIFSYLLTKL